VLSAIASSHRPVRSTGWPVRRAGRSRTS
jgi:hypothetical protein